MAVAPVAHAEHGLGLLFTSEHSAARELIDGEGLAVFVQHLPVRETLSRVGCDELVDRPVARQARRGEVGIHQPSLGVLDRDAVGRADRHELERVSCFLEGSGELASALVGAPPIGDVARARRHPDHLALAVVDR